VDISDIIFRILGTAAIISFFGIIGWVIVELLEIKIND
jgi:hypothetical protein